MNFDEFSAFRIELLSTRSNVIDCGETNAYRALSQWAVAPAPPPQSTVHRCHLAAEWAAYFDLDPAVARRAFVSCGVRDSLARLFAHYATAAARLWLPEDNYPVYGELATAADLPFRTFPTLLETRWPNAEPHLGPELLLVTNPLKPRSRFLSDHDVSMLFAWLRESPARRLLIDSVYTFGARFDPATSSLLDTQQTLLLHSVTKSWLHPRCFGVALVPEQDAANLAPLFRNDPPTQENLARARTMLRDHAATPRHIAAALMSARRRLDEAMPVGSPDLWACDAPGYLFPISIPWRDLLQQHSVLGIPATVFGSSRSDIAVLSSLGFVRDMAAHSV